MPKSGKDSNPEADALYIFSERGALAVSQHLTPPGPVAREAIGQALSLRELQMFGVELQHVTRITTTECSEWIGDAIDYGERKSASEGLPLIATYIIRPERLEWVWPGWQAIGGTRRRVMLPPSGWIVPRSDDQILDQVTGLPFATTEDENLAQAAADQVYSAYFWRGESGDGIRILNRECERIIGRFFDINATLSPDSIHPSIALRAFWQLPAPQQP